jgi:hypothetical protein
MQIFEFGRLPDDTKPVDGSTLSARKGRNARTKKLRKATPLDKYVLECIKEHWCDLPLDKKVEMYVKEVEDTTPKSALNEIEKAANTWFQANTAENDDNTLKDIKVTPTLLDTTILECINGKWCNMELDRKVDMYLEAVEKTITSETALYEIIDAANAWFQSNLPANGTKRNESKTTSLFPPSSAQPVQPDCKQQ